MEMRYGGKKGKQINLSEDKGLLVVRTQRRTSLSRVALSVSALRACSELETVEEFKDAGVEILRGEPRAVANARATLKKEPEIGFAGRVLVDRKSKAPVSYTENAFVKFHDDVKPGTCKRLLKDHELTVKCQLTYARNAYFVGANDGVGRRIFDLAATLLQRDEVELCHPEVVRRISYNRAFDGQWHLKATTIGGTQINAHANVEAAWPLSQGAGIVIAVIDDGVDVSHPELAGAGKIVAPRDVSRNADDPAPRSGDNHGTACAGVACANGTVGASGVAPQAKLMPIRLRSGLGSQAEATAFVWAADHGADVISCSWGPSDGEWWNPNDPTHNQVVALPDSTRLAIDYAIRTGRNGKGCVITWAAGNGNESVDNDGYAAYSKVIAVAASNDKGKRAAYSDFGKAIWCAFPSSNGNPSLTPGIWTTDRTGRDGYNPGDARNGDAAGDYTNSFGGTSSACPGVAGVAALVLSRNPELRWDEVREILRGSADRIDTAGGQYDGNGRSPFYGYGRVNALRAVEAARPAEPRRRVALTVYQDVAVEDNRKSKLTLDVAERKAPLDIRIAVDIEHTYIADLTVTLIPPQATKVTLHDRTGGGSDNIKKVYDTVSTPTLATALNASPEGTWTLEVQDTAAGDKGQVRSFTLELMY